MSGSRGGRDSNKEYKLILANLPESVRRLPQETSFKPVKDLMRGVVDYPDNMRLDVRLGTGKVVRKDMAMCPFRDEVDALDAYYKIDGYVWRHEEYETKLEASLYLFDKTNKLSPMVRLIGRELIPPMFLSHSGNFWPAGAMHTHPPVRPSGSIRGNRMSTNQRGHRMPRSTPGHALEPFLASPYQPSSHCMPPLPGFGTPMVDSSITTGTIPASQLSPVAADTDPHQRFLGQPPPYYYNSPVLDSTSRSSSISTMSNTYTASCGSNYVTLTDDGTTSIPGTPYASHNVSTSSEFSHAYPRMPSNSLSQSETLGASQGNERDVGYKIIIRKLPPGMTSQKLSELIQKEMPEYEYGQHEKPKRGENNKWSVTFLKEQVGIRAAARLAGVEFEGIKLQVIPDTRAAARRHTNSSGSTSGASSSSTTRGPVIVDGSLQD